MSDYSRWEDGAPTIRANVTRIHTARRKTHTCVYCRKTIEIGQKYEREFAVVDEVAEYSLSHVGCRFKAMQGE